MAEQFGQQTNRPLISVDKEIMGGTPVFAGTRVPVETLFEYLEQSETLDAFLDDFPTVKRRIVVALLESAKRAALASVQ